MNTSIKSLTRGEIPQIVTAIEKVGWYKPTSLFEKYSEEQHLGLRSVWVAFVDGQFAGYVTLKKESDYASFKEQGIPEISDLNVLPPLQKQGIGSKLLEAAEKEASSISPTVGIAVGLSADYGNAQRLYIKRGYLPDGQGITYRCAPVSSGDTVPVDDDLVLWFIKEIL